MTAYPRGLSLFTDSTEKQEPETNRRCQFSLMRAFIRRAGVYVWHTIVCVAVVGLILSVFWAVSYALSVHHRRQAERLLQELAALRPRVTGFRTAQQIAHDFGGSEVCISDLCSYDFDDSFAFPNSGPPGVLRRTEWGYLGLRPWRVAAHIETKNSQLTDVEFMAGVGRGQGWLYNQGLFSGNMWATLMTSVTINAGRFEQRLRLQRESSREDTAGTGHQIEAGSGGVILIKPSFDTPGGGEALEVYLSPDAPTESRRVAFDLNLRCATTMLPCTELCELAPSAWRAYSQFLKSNGWSVGEPTDCAAANRQ